MNVLTRRQSWLFVTVLIVLVAVVLLSVDAFTALRGRFGFVRCRGRQSVIGNLWLNPRTKKTSEKIVSVRGDIAASFGRYRSRSQYVFCLFSPFSVFPLLFLPHLTFSLVFFTLIYFSPSLFSPSLFSPFRHYHSFRKWYFISVQADNCASGPVNLFFCLDLLQ